jgi:hypothetical protein
MRPGDTFRARARWGETYETRFQVEGEFTVLLIEREDVHVCRPKEGLVTRSDTGQRLRVSQPALMFREGPDGLLRELVDHLTSFKGSHGFKEVEDVVLMIDGVAVTEAELDEAVRSAVRAANLHKTSTSRDDSEGL